MAFDISLLTELGMPQILLWLLVFAIIYGVLKQIQVPKSKASRGIISMVAAFFVLISVPTSFVSVISTMSSSMLIVILGFLTLMVFIELGGIRHKEDVPAKDEKGNIIPGKIHKISVPLFSKNPYVLGIAFIIIAALIFVGAGGLQLLGFTGLPQFNIVGAGIIIMILLAVLWMIKG